MNEDFSPAFREATQIIGQVPLPADAGTRLAALEKRIRPDERDRFGDLWEALWAASPEPPSVPPE